MPIRASRLNEMTDSEILALRFCDLPVTLKGSTVEQRAKVVFDELARRGIRFRPSLWIAHEWYNPDGTAGFAVPFYLLHPRLTRLERTMMYEAEGASLPESMSILRHETGHAVDEAFKLRQLDDYRRVFGSPNKIYPTEYSADSDSRDYVQHLNAWYAQSHPCEDFAETFAVWLRTERSWRWRYRDWPAQEKLLVVDQWMHERRNKRPRLKPKRQQNELRSCTRTLAEHYEEKREFYAVEAEDEFDGALHRIFKRQDTAGGGHASAASLLTSNSARLRRRIAKPLGIPAYVVDQVLRQFVHRARILKLRQAEPEAQTLKKVCRLVSRATLEIIQNKPRLPL